MKILISLFLICSVAQVSAAELFGVALANATRDELRGAVKNAGVKLVQQAGADSFYDIYKGGSVLHKADFLYLGFVKNDKRFAFAEYEFNGFKQPVLLAKLNTKYGLAKTVKGKFITDLSYSWLSEGTTITFYQDWKSYKTRLTYFNPEALLLLRNEQKQFEITSGKRKGLYQEQAY